MAPMTDKDVMGSSEPTEATGECSGPDNKDADKEEVRRNDFNRLCVT